MEDSAPLHCSTSVLESRKGTHNSAKTKIDEELIEISRTMRCKKQVASKIAIQGGIS